MRPIAILRHDPVQGPGFLLDVLQRHGVPWRVFAIDEGDTPPASAAEFAGIVVLGSDHSVHDPAPWIAAELALLQHALALSIPVLGHSFGGQLLARALGAPVLPNFAPHIGWADGFVAPGHAGRHWFGQRTRVPLFHWHYDTFAIPPGAQRVLAGQCCMNKGYALGPHLGLQSHLEITAETVRAWCEHGLPELDQAVDCPSVQSYDQILADLPARLDAVHAVAERVYARWLQGVQMRLEPIAASGARARYRIIEPAMGR